MKKFSEFKDRTQINPNPSLEGSRLVAVSGEGSTAVNYNVPASEIIEGSLEYAKDLICEEDILSTNVTGTTPLWINYVVLDKKHLGSGFLDKITFKAGSGADTVYKFYLNIFEKQKDGTDAPQSWKYLGTSEENLLLISSADNTWTFKNNIYLTGREIAIQAVVDKTTTWDETNKKFRANTIVTPSGDSSYVVGASKANYLPELKLILKRSQYDQVTDNVTDNGLAINGVNLTLGSSTDKIVRITGATEIDTYGGKINTMNGDVYHGSGSASFTETINDNTFTSTIDAHHFEARHNGELKVHLHADANGDASLELNGHKALTTVGSKIDSLPDSPTAVTLEHNKTVSFSNYTETVEITPSALTTAQEMRVLYSPAVARTTPLIAVPDGVTLHWAGDEEPTWEAGKDYVIQLLQTAPTHIEARLFNAPQGAKLPEWLKAPYIVHKNGVAVAADFEGQINGSDQFYNNPESVKALEEQLKTATFNQQTNGNRQFYAFKGQLSLPLATFAAQTAGTFQFMSSSDDASLYLPRATFESLSGLPVNFFYGCNIVVAPSAVFGKVAQFTTFNGSVNRRDDRHADFASATFERLLMVDVIVDTAPVILKLYSLNLRILNNAANGFPHGPAPERFNEHWRESLLSLVYGPRLQVDESGAFVRNAAGNCVAAPVLKTDPVSGEPVSLEPEELTGRRFMPADAGDRPTGWGIQDFRELDENGNFARKADGSYKHKSAGHSIKVPVTDSAQSESMGGSAAYGADIAAALQELSDRGWTLAWARII